MEYPYKVPYHKRKFRLLIVVCLLFVLVFLSLIFSPASSSVNTLNLWAGIAGLIFFGGGALLFTQILRSGKLAIEVNDEGIRDETTKVAVGLIRWEDITGFELHHVFGHPWIAVRVRDPEVYKDRARNGLAKRAMNQNEKKYGSALQLNCGSVKIPPEELLSLLQAELDFQRKLESGPGVSLAELIRQRNALYR